MQRKNNFIGRPLTIGNSIFLVTEENKSNKNLTIFYNKTKPNKIFSTLILMTKKIKNQHDFKSFFWIYYYDLKTRTLMNRYKLR